MLSEEEIYRRRMERLRQQKREQAKRRRQREVIRRVMIITIVMLVVTGGILLIHHVKKTRAAAANGYSGKIVENPPDYTVDLLDINEYSRPGIALEKVNSIVIHYTANPGTTAKQNRDYFNGLQDSHLTKASAHFIIGLDGEIVQCIPCNEVSYASNDRNYDTISIECCHEDKTGKFNQETEDTLVHLTAWLLGRYGLTTEDVIRHYDVSGKKCPIYYVEHEKEWETFLKKMDEYIEKNGVVPEPQ